MLMASKALSLLLYNILMPVGFLIMLPGAIVKMRRRNGKWRDLAQRFGVFSAETKAAIAALPREKRLWMHAVSVGEVNVATKLMTRLLQADAGVGIVLSTTTPTGHALAVEFAAKHAGRVVVIYSPLDFFKVGWKLLKLVQPAQLVLVEAEVWPNLTAAAARRGVPVSLVNARLSPRSARRYLKFKWFISPIFRMLKQVLVQEQADVARWQSFGIEPSRIHLTGSIKYDPDGAAVSEGKVEELRGVLSRTGVLLSQPVLLAASTHAGEEIEMARVFQKLRQSIPNLVLLIVPRHVERRAEIVAALQTISLQPALRSNPAATVEPAAPCLIIDTTGELAAWQHLATVVVIGKSFLAEGGQNPAEAALAKKPVLFGPHMENFTPLVDLLLKHKGARQVVGFDELTTACCELLADATAAQRMAANGNAALVVHEGATRRTAGRILQNDEVAK